MFRCITNLKGFCIDADGLTEDDLTDAKEFLVAYKFCFLTTHRDIAVRINNLYGGGHVKKIGSSDNGDGVYIKRYHLFEKSNGLL